MQLHEELAPVRQARQRVVGGEVLQLAGALFDLRLELAVILASELLRGRQVIGHLVERDGERVELLDAAARHGDARFAACDPFGGAHEAPDRQHDASHRAHDRRKQQEQDDGTQPAEQAALPVLLLRDRVQHDG